MGRPLIIALVVSVILNIFAVGFISGRALTPKSHPPRPPGLEMSMGDPRRYFRHTEVLAPDQRDAFRAALRSEMMVVRENRRVVHDKRRAYAQALRAEPWDRAAIEQAQGELSQAQAVLFQSISAAMLNAFDVLEPEARAQLIEHARAQQEMRREFRRKGPPGERRPWREPPPHESGPPPE